MATKRFDGSKHRRGMSGGAGKLFYDFGRSLPNHASRGIKAHGSTRDEAVEMARLAAESGVVPRKVAEGARAVKAVQMRRAVDGGDAAAALAVAERAHETLGSSDEARELRRRELLERREAARAARRE